MRIGIIGAGAIGMLLASFLGKKQEIIIFSNRAEQKNSIKTSGVHLYETSNWKQSTSVKVSELDEKAPSLDCCFICVKQSQLPNIMTSLQNLPADLPLIFVQNGMGHLDALQTLIQPVYIGMVSHGVKRLNDVSVSHNGDGEISLAAFRDGDRALHELINALHQKDFPFEAAQDWLSIMKNKMLVNSVINPLTALFQVPNGMILKNESIVKLAKKLCLEATTVLQLEYDVAWKNVADIAAKTENNTSSMLQDILNGKETEIRAISGYLLSESTTSLPYTSFVYESIIALERKEKLI